MPTLPELRLNKFLTQQDLANQMGVFATQVSDWERGVNRPSMRHLRSLCEILEVRPGEIVWPAPHPKEPAEVGHRGSKASQ
jgi:transcriptional regulator with XRE-family HTH domain